MSKVPAFIPQAIIDNSKKIDKIIFFDRMSIASLCGLFVIYFGGLILGLAIKEFPSKYIPYWGVSLIIFFSLSITFFFLAKSGSERKNVSYLLYKISKGIKSNKLDMKYLKYMNEKLTLENEESIKKKDYIFESERLKGNRFFTELRELINMIYHMHLSQKLDKLDINLMNALSRDVYYRNRDLFGTIRKITTSYRGREKIPGAGDTIKKAFNSKIIKVVLWEVSALILSTVLYQFIYSNMKTAIIFFATLSLPAVSALLK